MAATSIGAPASTYKPSRWRGLRDSVKIMIGGGQMDDQVCAYAKADAYGKDAMAAVRLAKGCVGVN